MRHQLLESYRQSRGLSQRALAVRLGWSQSKVSRLELGKQTLTVDDLQELAEALTLTWSERIALLEAPEDHSPAA